MSRPSSTKTRIAETLAVAPDRGIESILDFTEALAACSDAKTIAQTLAEQVHNSFFPAPAGILVIGPQGLRIVGFASEDPELGAALTEEVKQTGSPLAQILARACDSDRPELHQLEISPENPFQLGAAYCFPFRAPHSCGVLALFLNHDQRLDESGRSFFSLVARTGILAFSNAGLQEDVHLHSGEFQELLDICAEVGSSPSLNRFLERFVVRAANFLGYRGSLVALVEDGVCRARWASRDGVSSPLNVVLDSAKIRQVLASKEPFWSEEAGEEDGIDRTLPFGFQTHQLFSLPLVGYDGECLGILVLLDRTDSRHISEEQVRRAKALAAQVTVTLQSARSLEISERHRHRAETLVSYATDLGSAVELDDLVGKFTSRGMEMLEASAGFMALVRGARSQAVALKGIPANQERQVAGLVNHALEALIIKPPMKACAISCQQFDPQLATELGWRQVILVPLYGTGKQLLAFLGLANCRRNSRSDIELIQAMATHAAAALQNSQLFARITRSSREWAEMFDSISDLMLLHDEQQRVVRVNRSLSEKLNKQPSQVLGLLVRDLFAASSNLSACPFCLDLRGEEFREEFREPKTGNIYLVSSSRVRGAAEDSQQVVHVLKDVTASRRAERLYRELFDNIQEGAYFSAPDGRLLEVNDALVRMLGYNSREQLLSVSAEDLYVEPADREIVTRALNQFGRLRNHELALLRRDRSIIYVLENSFVVRDENGRVVEYRGVLLDITEIKHVQSQLLREHDFNTQILNHTQSLIVVADTAGLVSYANRRCCEVAAGGQSDLVGSRLEKIVAPSHRSVLHQALECVLDGKVVNNLDLPLVRGNQSIGSFSVNLSPMKVPSGEVNSLVAVMTDISDVAMLQAKLMHTEKMAAVGQLVSGVAHEVNNPLTAIMGFADLLLESPELSGDVREDLQVILQEAQRTREIVQNLLSFARQTPPEKQLVDINKVLRRTISLRAYDMASHGIELLEEFDSKVPEIIGDAHQLQQVFLNILNNACDAVRETGRHGKISITTKQVAGSVEVLFQDNGPGIRNADRIFDPFYTTKEVGKGTGLGLSICYGIVREHNGEILCFNNQNAEGATFAIRLPLIENSAGKVLAASSAN